MDTIPCNKVLVLCLGLLVHSWAESTHADTLDTIPWQLAKDAGSVQVYHRTIPGWNVDEFRGVGVDSIPIAVGFQALSDLAAYPQWIQYLQESRIVSRQGPDTLLVYHKYDLPWPFDDRDVMVRAVLQRDYRKGVLRAQLVSVAHTEIPIPSGCIRIPRMMGSIELRHVSRQVTEWSFSERLDIGGSSPLWLRSLFGREIPIAILTQARNQVRKPKYAQLAIGSPEQLGIESAITAGVLPP